MCVGSFVCSLKQYFFFVRVVIDWPECGLLCVYFFSNFMSWFRLFRCSYIAKFNQIQSKSITKQINLLFVHCLYDAIECFGPYATKFGSERWQMRPQMNRIPIQFLSSLAVARCLFVSLENWNSILFVRLKTQWSRQNGSNRHIQSLDSLFDLAFHSVLIQIVQLSWARPYIGL